MTVPIADTDTPRVRCSFCGKSKDAVRRLVEGAGGSVRICNECVEHSAKIIERADFEEAPPLSEDLENLLSATLDAYCEGSRRAEGALRERLFDMEADAKRLDWCEANNRTWFVPSAFDSGWVIRSLDERKLDDGENPDVYPSLRAAIDRTLGTRPALAMRDAPTGGENGT